MTKSPKQIEWLRSHRKPQEALRNAIDTSMRNSLDSLKKKEAELIDMHRLLGDSAQDNKRLKATWQEIKALRKKIADLKH